MSGARHVGSRDEGPPAGGEVGKFPAQPYASASSFFAAYSEELARAAGSIDSAQVERAAAVLVEAYSAGARVLSCGNGGSASIANHFQCDHLRVGRGTDLSPALAPKVLSLSTNIELLTAIANDIGYEDVFRYQLEAQSQPGDVLMAISSSGRSANIARAVSWARDNGRRTIALTGFDGGGARMAAEIAIHVDCNNYGIIEDIHQGVMHALAQYVRQSRMTARTIAATTF
jgi:phosphoheptose isomerase